MDFQPASGVLSTCMSLDQEVSLGLQHHDIATASISQVDPHGYSPMPRPIKNRMHTLCSKSYNIMFDS